MLEKHTDRNGLVFMTEPSIGFVDHVDPVTARVNRANYQALLRESRHFNKNIHTDAIPLYQSDAANCDVFIVSYDKSESYEVYVKDIPENARLLDLMRRTSEDYPIIDDDIFYFTERKDLQDALDDGLFTEIVKDALTSEQKDILDDILCSYTLCSDLESSGLYSTQLRQGENAELDNTVLLELIERKLNPMIEEVDTYTLSTENKKKLDVCIEQLAAWNQTQKATLSPA